MIASISGLFRSLEQLDRSISLWINGYNHPASDSIWLMFSDKEVWFPLYGLIIILLFVKLGWKKALLAIALIAACIALCDQLANLVKNWVGRLRPNKDDWMIESGVHILEYGGLYGFFSAHAANSFALAMSSSRIVGSRGRWKYCAPVIFLWASLVSLSRIFVAKHFLGDVIVGTCVGLSVGWLFSLAAAKLFKAFFHTDAA